MEPSTLRLALASAVLLGTPALAHAAAEWHADSSHSRLTFSATQAGARFEGRFASFTPKIVFEPTDLDAGRILVTVDTRSADTKDRERNETLLGKDFFDVARWPEARYEASKFESLGSNRYVANGTLTLRGVTRPVRLNFTFSPGAGGATASMAGNATVRRLEFGVGQGEWTDTTWVGDDVEVRFELSLNRNSLPTR